jgi:hypothetical protein
MIPEYPGTQTGTDAIPAGQVPAQSGTGGPGPAQPVPDSGPLCQGQDSTDLPLSNVCRSVCRDEPQQNDHLSQRTEIPVASSHDDYSSELAARQAAHRGEEGDRVRSALHGSGAAKKPARKTAAKKTAAAKAPRLPGPSDPESRKAVADARKAVKNPTKLPAPSPGAARLAKAVKKVQTDAAKKAAPTKKAAPAVKKAAKAVPAKKATAAAPARKAAGAPLRKAPARPVKRSSTRRTVGRVNRALGQARRHPLRAGRTVLLFAVIGGGRTVRAGYRRARLRLQRMRSAAAARRAAARLNAAPSAHANCAVCNGTGTVPVFDGDHRFLGSRPCGGAR